jgi:hypothetical protein
MVKGSKYMKETTLVYREPTQETEERRERFSLVAWQNDWEIYNIQKRGENTPYTMSYMTPDEKTGINYIENYVFDIPYIAIRGENQEQVAEILRASIDFYNIDELQDFIHSAPEDDTQLSRAIYLLGVAVGKASDVSYFDSFELCLAHPASNVRRAAMLSVAGVGWPEFRPLLEHIRDNDSDPELRNYANTTLESMQTHIWSSQTV